MEELLTVKEAADYLRVEPKTVRDYIKAGKLPAIQLRRGSAIRIRREDIPKAAVKR